ncbi:hypothetical protein C0Q70_06894 [Pomacea canaliculata]|uniref:DEK-C domain-containing protein n=1 Tax=Pomacea canaliculata TaxID=400727 RepID=A0A2T7PDI4_POMCA|nr:hypothetical protein C0Q70_06894 [Pomacea canaliculata]
MEEIEPFVRRLCNEEDLSVLTKKMVRKRYQSHFKKDSVSPEERQKINEVLDVILEELARGNKKSKRRKINRLSSSDDDDSSQDALLAEDSSGVEQLSYTIQKSDGDSDGETSELSKSSGSEDENGLSESPMKIKSKKPSSRKRLRSISPDNKQTKTESRPQSEKTEKTEHPYLKRLKLICRKVGIFVRSDVHFAGCQTDKDRIERLKEVLRKAGMKGQPSLSKVDSVNLKKEAADLDPSNIIETSGRPRRQLKGFFAGETSSSKVEISTRQQFSRIQDLVTVSDSD